MTIREIKKAVAELQELEGFIAELQAEAEAIKDSIKSEMTSMEIETIDLGDKIIRYQTILSNRFDTTNFKKAYAELYKSYTKQVVSRKFSVA